MSRIELFGNIRMGVRYESPFDYSLCTLTVTASFTGSYGGDTFDCYLLDSEVNGLNGGNGWVGSWVCPELDVRIYGLDTFESYTIDSEVNGLSGGTEWGGNWACPELYIGAYGLDTFESYESGSTVNGLSGGTEWGGNWADYTLG